LNSSRITGEPPLRSRTGILRLHCRATCQRGPTRGKRRRISLTVAPDRDVSRASPPGEEPSGARRAPRSSAPSPATSVSRRERWRRRRRSSRAAMAANVHAPRCREVIRETISASSCSGGREVATELEDARQPARPAADRAPRRTTVTRSNTQTSVDGVQNDPTQISRLSPCDHTIRLAQQAEHRAAAERAAAWWRTPAVRPG
jgi:hypothetical protein